MRDLKFKFKYKVTGGSRGGARGPGRPFYFGWKKKEEERKKDENHASS